MIFKTDAELKTEYKKILSRIEYNTTSSAQLKITNQPRASTSLRQDRVIENFNKTQNHWIDNLRQTCSSIGRRPCDSIITHSLSYRKKVEASNFTEIAANHGSKYWYVNLRKSPMIKIDEPYTMKIGNDSAGLFVRILESTSNNHCIIRIPGTSQQQNRNGFTRKHEKTCKQKPLGLMTYNSENDLDKLFVYYILI